MKTRKSALKSLLLAVPLTGAFWLGCSDDNDSDLVGLSPSAEASANVRGYTDSTIQGTVTFQAVADSMLIQGSVSGLIPGTKYGVHVHEFGDCTTPNASGAHFDSIGQVHGNPDDTLPLHHFGDLPNLVVDANGTGHFEITTNSMSLGTGSRSILGRSVVVHLLPDDYVTQPAGGTDGRIACGIIESAAGGTIPVTDTTDNNPLDTNRVPLDTNAIPADTANKPPITPGY
jgi:Cu-Zn family superoxide dismutase